MGIKFISIVLLNTYLSSSASLKIKRTVAKSSLKELVIYYYFCSLISLKSYLLRHSVKNLLKKTLIIMINTKGTYV